MLIGTFGDIHFRWTVPASRTDDFVVAQLRKFQEGLDIFAELRVKTVCLPGDVFDTHTARHGLVESVIPLFREAHKRNGMQFFVVFGQHDQRFHTSEKADTPLGVLLQALGSNIMNLLCENPYTLRQNDDIVSLYGRSWGEDEPKPEDPQGFNILVQHRTVYEKSSGWEDKNAIECYELSKMSPFAVVVCGDNHKQFSYTPRNNHGAVIINPGSLLRQSIDQMSHEPAVYIYDTEKDALFREPLTIEKDVFKVSLAEGEEISQDRLDTFIATLQNRSAVTMNFKENVSKALETAKLHADTKNVINEIMEVVE